MSLEERVSKLESLMPLDFADYPVSSLITDRLAALEKLAS
ncbi:Uncharacterised protein [Klebsiella pneumoniae]|nr:Uncharacterised protein [Klebsiella pneumoniae]SVU98185.1 Uncharacterised protein [Klebsiella pneumoniae]